MGLHKLSAGDGYSYLTRQVAVHDASEKGHTGLGDYYSERGEAPGRWAGAGLAGLGMAAGEDVTAAQMKALFGEGRHPNAAVPSPGVASGNGEALPAPVLGRPFAVYHGVNEFQTAVAREFTATNVAAGRRWDAPIPASERARIRTGLATDMFTYEFGRPPADARELSGFIARVSRPATTAVAGYDLTFSPVKSVSTLWAVAPGKIAGQIEAAHEAAISDTLAWLEKEAAFTRTGPAGIRQVETNGLIAAVFTHRDARSGDPDLHTHVAVSNKVQTRDGAWLALDGRVLYKAKVAASERYNTRLEAELTARLGIRFAERPGGDAGKRAVREIIGIDPDLNAFWSSRRAVINTRRAELAAIFQHEHGRVPTAVEAISQAHQATLETRQAKHEPRSLAEQRTTWRDQAAQILGSTDALARMIATATNPTRQPRFTELSEHTVADIAGSVLAVVQGSRATWQVWHVRAEAERYARAAGIGIGELDTAVDRIVATALAPGFSIRLGVQDAIREPEPLRRSDGSSVYVTAGSALYTSQSIIEAERSLLTAARRADGRAVTPAAVGVALAESAANGVTLTPAQARLVSDLATSGQRVQVAIAPAGSGKTTAMRTLAAAWTDSGGTVIGLAPSARAAAELGHALGPSTRNTGTNGTGSAGSHTDTLAKLTHSLTTHLPPAWVDGIGPSTLVIIDEAGLAGTLELATAVTHILGRGGSVRLVGDDQQLESFAAGGVLRDIADQVGATGLSTLHRFTDPGEAAATLALRDGDPAALGFYLDNNRVHVGDLATITEHAYQAWASDRADGVDAVLLAPTRDLVTALNTRARSDRLATTRQPAGREVALADGTHASAGDVIITRSNNRQLPISATDWVKNGDRWQVRNIHPTGAVIAVHLATHRTITLPAGYVGDYVELGYASTVHSAQGTTADTSHLIATGTESRQLLYVGMTRARQANHVYLATAPDGDPHTVIRPETVSPLTAADMLTAILHRDQAQHSAATVARHLADPAVLLHEAVTRYQDALTVAAEDVLGAGTLTAIDAAAEHSHPGLSAAPAYLTLRARLALLAVNGTDPAAALRAVTGPGTRDLGTALDPAAVLDWRITPPDRAKSGERPLPWLPPIPAVLGGDARWGAYLTARAARITELDTLIREHATGWTASTAPAWATGLLGPAQQRLLGDLAVWRAATGVPTQERRSTGPRQSGAAASRHQQALQTRVSESDADPHHATTTWGPVLARIDARISLDPFRPEATHRLAALDDAGVDTRGLLITAVGEHPLPDEHPAAALWWRLTRHLPAATDPHALDNAAVPPDPHNDDVVQPDDSPNGEADVDEPYIEDIAADGSLPVTDVEDYVEDLAAAGAVLDRAIRTATLLRGPLEPTEAEQWAALDEEYTWATAAVPRDRLIDLNNQATTFFTAHYARSWALAYLIDRLGTDLTGDDRFTPGYAPAGWATLTAHLRHHGATDAEIVAAGLGRVASTGRVIDQFRDRLMFPIHGQDGEIHGFIGRRNPNHDSGTRTDGSVPSAGPKYLNTPRTDLFDKSGQLFGLHEARTALADGATPVVVEGPLDAIAVTHATNGEHVGVAALGTAFGDTHARQLLPHIGPDKPGIIIATDGDPAGWKAAQRAYWTLTIHGADPGYIRMPDGMDPAGILQTGGPAALQHLLIDRQPLARILIDHTISERRPTIADQAVMISDIATIIAALPPRAWTAHHAYAAEQLTTEPDVIERAVSHAAAAWTADPRGMARQQIRAGGLRLPNTPTPPGSPYGVSRASMDRPMTVHSPIAGQNWHHIPVSVSTPQPAEPSGPNR